MPALQAAGVEVRRIYDMRHTFATWSVAAGMSIFTLSRRMGTSVQMIDSTMAIWRRTPRSRTAVCWMPNDAANSGRGHDVGTTMHLHEGADEDAARQYCVCGGV